MTSEPLKNAGPSPGQFVKDLDNLLDEYYEALGYTKEGIPTIEKLKELGMEDVIARHYEFFMMQKKGGENHN
jgi:aldehyde:ferredoxin oxidoreductase